MVVDLSIDDNVDVSLWVVERLVTSGSKVIDLKSSIAKAFLFVSNQKVSQEIELSIQRTYEPIFTDPGAAKVRATMSEVLETMLE